MVADVIFLLSSIVCGKRKQGGASSVRIAPTPVSDVFTSTMNGSSGLGCFKIVAVIKAL